MKKYSRIIVAYACEDSGSEPGVGFYWAKSIAQIEKGKKILLLTRQNNDVSAILKLGNVDVKRIDLSKRTIKLKKIIGVRLYYLIWQFLVFWFLITNYSSLKSSIIHQITFTPMYYPPVFFALPYKFIWGPIGGGETYPLKYLKSLKRKDSLKELIRQVIRFSIYINPVFYIACYRSEKIICSTEESAKMIPSFFRKKVNVELMVFDNDKEIENTTKQKTVVIANRLIDWKMTHLFVEAFDEYIKKVEDSEFKLIIIGDGPYYSNIKPFIDGINIIHYKRFEKREDMLEVLKESSLFVSMSLRDSGAASLLEAISYGLPFLVSNSGAHRFFLDQKIGYGFDLNDFSYDKNQIINILLRILNQEILLKESLKVRKVYGAFFNEKAKLARIERILLN